MLLVCFGLERAACARPADEDPEGVTQKDFNTLWNLKEMFFCPKQVTWG
jgi:hypothetical protein